MTSAWIVRQTGTPDVFAKNTIALPEVNAGEVRVRVCAAGFNPVDTKIRAGLAPILNDTRVLGCDVSGEVVAVGDGVDHLAVGDSVYGCAGGVKGNTGALAEEMVCDADLLARAPQSLSLAQAAAIPLVAITAFEALQRLTISNQDKLMKWTPLPYTETSVFSREVVYGTAKSDRNRPGKVGDSDSWQR
ncbi:MAG: alcohol dehydrogenase catalytic domain-containing protein [Pseudomonadota bacterium]